MKQFFVMAAAVTAGFISAQLLNYAYQYSRGYYICVYKAPGIIKEAYGVDVMTSWNDGECVIIPKTKP